MRLWFATAQIPPPWPLVALHSWVTDQWLLSWPVKVYGCAKSSRSDSRRPGESHRGKLDPIESQPLCLPCLTRGRAPQQNHFSVAMKSISVGRCAAILHGPSSRDSLSSRLIASRTSAPPSVAFAPWGEIGETGQCCPFRNPNHVVTVTLSGGGTGCPLRIRWSRSSWFERAIEVCAPNELHTAVDDRIVGCQVCSGEAARLPSYGPQPEHGQSCRS